MNNFKHNLILIISVIFVAVTGSILVNYGMEWFNMLAKPSQWLPNFVIPVVWTIIYLIYTIFFFIQNSKYGINKNDTVCLIINGILNILWCLTFFTLKLTFVGFCVIVINDLFAFLIANSQKGKNLSWILYIYPIWTCIATGLNVALWILN